MVSHQDEQGWTLISCMREGQLETLHTWPLVLWQNPRAISERELSVWASATNTSVHNVYSHTNPLPLTQALPPLIKMQLSWWLDSMEQSWDVLSIICRLLKQCIFFKGQTQNDSWVKSYLYCKLISRVRNEKYLKLNIPKLYNHSFHISNSFILYLLKVKTSKISWPNLNSFQLREL